MGAGAGAERAEWPVCSFSRKRKAVCSCKRAGCGASLCWVMLQRGGSDKPLQKPVCPCKTEGCGRLLCWNSDRSRATGNAIEKKRCNCKTPGCGTGFCMGSGREMQREYCSCPDARCVKARAARAARVERATAAREAVVRAAGQS